MPAIAPKAISATTKAYSTRSWPSSRESEHAISSEGSEDLHGYSPDFLNYLQENTTQRDQTSVMSKARYETGARSSLGGGIMHISLEIVGSYRCADLAELLRMVAGLPKQIAGS